MLQLGELDSAELKVQVIGMPEDERYEVIVDEIIPCHLPFDEYE